MQNTLARTSSPPAPQAHKRHWGRWLLGSALFVLLLLYLAGVFRVQINLELNGMPGVTDARFVPVLTGITSSVATTGKVTGFYGTPEEIFASRLALIKTAKQTIRFETYFMTPGRRADELQAALLERRAHGVNVEFVVDSQGAWGIPSSYWDKMKAGGIEVRYYSPFDWKNPRLYNDRTHRKLLLIDGTASQVGGAGVSDNWDGEKGGPAWEDLEIRLEGPVVPVLEGAFLQHWIHEGGVGDLTADAVKALPPTGQTTLVTFGDPTHGDSQIRTLYTAAILAARHKLWISSPYFLPNTNARDMIVDARKRGVEVRILTEGPKNDNGVAYEASRQIYQSLLEAGCDIEEYQPAMMHAKSIVIDDEWVCTGSANFDPRALFHNDELNVSLVDPALARRFEGFFQDGFTRSHRVTLDDIAKRSWLAQGEGILGYAFRWQL